MHRTLVLKNKETKRENKREGGSTNSKAPSSKSHPLHLTVTRGPRTNSAEEPTMVSTGEKAAIVPVSPGADISPPVLTAAVPWSRLVFVSDDQLKRNGLLA